MPHEHAPAAGVATGHWIATILLAGAAVAVYLAATGRAQRRLQRPWPSARTAGWTAGVGLVAAAVSPPVAAFAHRDPTGHMAQHLLLGMFAPLGLVLAAPVTLLLGASSTPVRRRIGTVLGSRYLHVLGHPFTAAALATGTLYLLYLTPLYAATTGSALLHALVNVHFVLAGSLFVWAIAGPDPAPGRPGMGTRLVALLASTAAHSYLAKLLYAHAALFPPGAAHAVSRDELAARWMYHGGDVAELLLAIALFTAWYRGRVPARAADRTTVGAVAPAGATRT
ncbi:MULTISPECIES: cytochrome c oxidase assembly protein [unclassified Blastococcus]|uniref:cytochrome c oxidase assembly protein n=1 Tax=unclassified Blastococcus TaxID=2619396 RepID=UPI001EF075FE|nr:MULTISPECIES: cytochrome c oxidase assembly protein [unclassified Blastococcus]